MFDNKLIVITGGSSGLGKALAERFAGMGASLALVARDRAKLDKVRGELASLCRPGRSVRTFPCDVSDHGAAVKTIDAIAAAMGAPDMLVNSAGILKEGYFETLPPDTFRQVMDINYFGTLYCTMAAMKHFRAKGGGTLVNISSLGGKMASFGYTAYCSSKFALVGLTDTLRCELGPRGVRVHLVLPPGVRLSHGGRAEHLPHGREPGTDPDRTGPADRPRRGRDDCRHHERALSHNPGP